MILAVPWLVWRLGRTERWAPLVVVQILTGIVLGPGLLGAAFPEAYRWLFTTEVIGALGGIATWGVMLFVWIAGIELDLHQAWQRRRDTVTTVALAARSLGWPPGEARMVGWLLQTKALILIIFANILLDRQVIGSETFTALVLMATFSTMLTIPMVTARRGLGAAQAPAVIKTTG